MNNALCHRAQAGALCAAFAVLFLTAGCHCCPRQVNVPFLSSDLISSASAGRQDAAALFAELGGEEAFVHLTRYLYRWYLDENDLQRLDSAFASQLWIRRVEPAADPEDKSRYLEVVFPATGVMVALKKTDYRIPELRLDVTSDGYRITHICRDLCKRAVRRGDYAVLELNLEALYARLFESRLERRFPDDALLAHLKESAACQIAELRESVQTPPESQTLYYAPIHPIANELWAFWEEGKILFRFTSDIDLTNAAVWNHDTLGVALYNTAEQTVVSHEERPGDDRYITRDQVGRALYNCIVLGKKTVLTPRAVK